MITYLIIGITVILSFICFSNRELFIKLAFIPYRTIRNHEYYRDTWIYPCGYDTFASEYVHVLVIWSLY